MSVRVMADVWDFGPIEATLTHIMLALANSADDDGGNCFPGTALIAQRARCSERTAIRAIAELERQGWISIVQRGSGRPRGKNRREKAAYMSQYLINTEKLEAEKRKGCHSVTLSRPAKRVTPAQERVTLTTEKGDTDDNPPHPLLGRSISDPSVNHPPVSPPPAGDGLLDDQPLTPEQENHLAVCAPGMRGDFEHFYREENMREAEKRRQAAQAEERAGAMRVLLPDQASAVRWVMEQCGFAGGARGLRRAIGGALTLAGMDLAGRRPMALWEAAPRMAEAWRQYCHSGPLLDVRYGPKNFFALAIWDDQRKWAWSDRKLRAQEARVGS